MNAVVYDAPGSFTITEVPMPVPKPLVRVSPYDVFRREITLKGSFAEINSFSAAIAPLRTGRARTDGLITHRFALDDYADALDALRGDRTVHKIIECWPQ